jgi:hypothetical protein
LLCLSCLAAWLIVGVRDRINGSLPITGTLARRVFAWLPLAAGARPDNLARPGKLVGSNCGR